MIIYKITNLVNGKFYIGKTTRAISVRFDEHCKKASSEMPITMAISKYGKQNFIVEQIDIASSLQDLNEKEKHYISILHPEYNVSPGGDGGPLFKGHTHTEAAKEKQRQYRLGKKDLPETKAKKSQSRLKWKHSRETIDKYSEAQAKEYTFINPNGEIVVIRNLNKFCRENNLSSANMRSVYAGRVNICKGYRRAF